MQPIKRCREAGGILGREGVALLAKKFIDECDGSYKGVMELSGKLLVISKIATFDDYWLEQVNRGRRKGEFEVDKTLEEA